MIRFVLYVLLLCSLAYPQEVRDSADQYEDEWEVFGPVLSENPIPFLEDDSFLELDDLEPVEESTHRFLELVAEQVRQIRPELSLEVDQELEKTRHEDKDEDEDEDEELSTSNQRSQE